MRKHLFAANWKMYKTPDESTAFIERLSKLLPANTRAEVAIFPSTPSLPAAVAAVKGTAIAIGAQNVHWLDAGAYTGETSPTMLLALGVTHVLIGHSERRQYFNESDTTVNLKLKSALTHKLVPIVCVGEHLVEREAGRTANVLELQVSLALEGLDPTLAAPLVFAYEPVWAIGTGRTATPEIAEDAHKLIRAAIARSLGNDLAQSTRILYGGSVKPDNAGSLCCLSDVDGALVGGASLDPNSFAEIIANATG
jgi:triosephosphate isomerase